MSREIDEKIVEMRFENQNFEQNAQQSMSTLEKLKKALNMTGAAKSFEEIDDAAKKVNMSGLENGIESLNRSFSALEVMGITALANITNSAVNAGKKVVSALTIDPVKSGFQEYETQINAIQTILANTAKEGTTLSQVNAALDELNRYADKTIYNFTQMTRNIGTFTAAGVDLDTSVSAIKGIANLAAVSGSTSEQASRAMYQLSQALASGTVKLMDWNSVMYAGMAGEVFQDALKETARVHGIAIDQMIEDEGTFRETLHTGWLTSDILTETLAKFTGDLTESQLLTMGYTEEQIAGILQLGQTANDAATKVKTFTQLFSTLSENLQSGWTQTWELIVGDFEQAKTLLTSISDVLGGFISESAEARNSLLEGALTQPKVTKMDWYGLAAGTEYAGILQDQLIKTAKTHGIAIDEMIDGETTFADTLDEGWLTWEIFTEALNGIGEVVAPAEVSLDELTKSYTSLAEAIIKGDYGNGADRIKRLTEAGYDYAKAQEFVNKVLKGEALTVEDVKGLTTELSDEQLKSAGYTDEQVAALREFAASADVAGSKLYDFKNLMERPTGRDLLIDIFANAFEGLVKILSSVKDAWDETFEALTSEGLYNIIDSIHSFSEALIISDEAALALKDAFKGVFSIVNVVVKIVTSFVKAISRVTPAISGVVRVLTSVAGLIGRVVFGFNDAIAYSGLFEVAFGTLGDLIGILADGFNFLCNTIAAVIDAFSDFPIIDAFYTALSSIVGFLYTQLQGLTNVIYTAVNAVIEFAFGIENGFETINDAGFSFAEFVDTVITNFNAFLDTIKQAPGIKNLLDALSKAEEGFRNFITIVVDAAESFVEVVGSIFTDTEVFNTIGTVLMGVAGVVAGAMALIINAVLGGLQGIADSKLFTVVSDKFHEFWQSITGASDGTSKSGVAKVFSDIKKTLETDFSELFNALKKFDVVEALKDLVSGIIDSFKNLNTGVYEILEPAITGIKELLGGDEALVNIVGLVELWVLVKVLKALKDSIDPLDGLFEETAKTIGKLGDALISFAKSAKIKALSEAVKDLAIGIGILSASIYVLSKVPVEDLTPAVAIIGTLMIAMGLLAEKLSSLNGVASTFSLAALVLALDSLIGPIAILAIIPFPQLAKAIVALGVALGGLVGSMVLLSKFATQIGAVAAPLIALSVAIDLLVAPLLAMAVLPYSMLEQGLGALASCMIALVLAAGALSLIEKDILRAAGALLALSLAIDLLIPAMLVLGNVDPNKLLPNIAAVSALVAVIAIASPALTTVAAACAALTAALAVIVVTIPAAVFAFGALFGILKSLKGFNAPIDQLVMGFVALVAAIALSASIIPILASLGKALIKIGGGLAMATAAVAAFGVVSVLFSKFAESIAAGAESLILTICRIIQNTGPVIIQTIIGLIDALLQALADHAYTITMSLIHILAEILNVLLDIIVAGLGDLGHTIMSMLGFEGSFFDQMFQSWTEAGNKSVADHYAKGVGEGADSKSLTNAAGKATKNVTKKLDDGGEDIEESGEKNLDDYISGFLDKSSLNDLTSESGQIPIDQIKAMAKSNGLFGDLSDDEIDAMLSTWNGASKDISKEASSEIKESATKTAKQTEGAWANVGEDTILGIIEGLQSQNPVVAQAAKNMIYRILGITQEAAEIHSPSLLFKEEVGEYIVQGIAEGIESDMSAEEAAAQKAGNIADAFQEAMDKVSLDMDIIDVDWDKYAAAFDDVSEADDYFVKRAETLSKKITSQTEIVTLARNEYNTTLKEFGEASEYTKEAYIRMVQAETELVALQKELDDLSIEQYEKMIEAYNKKTDLINQRIDIIERERSLTEAMYGDAISEEASKYLGANSALKSYGKTLSKVKNLQEKYNAILKDEHATEEQINDAYGELLDARTDLVNLAGDFAASFGMNDIATSLLTNVTGAISALTTDPKLASVAKGVSTALTKVVGENAASGITNGVNKFFNGGGTDILANALTLASSIASGDAANAITASFQLVGSIAGSEFGQAVTSKIWKVLTSGDNDGFIGTVKNALNKAGGLFDSSGIKGIVSGIGQKIGSWLNKSTGAELSESGSGGGFLGTLKTVISKVAGKLNLSGIFEVISGIGSTIGSWLLKAFNGVLGGAGGLLDILKNIIGGIANFFTGGSGALQTIANVGADVGNAMKTGFTAMVGNGEATNGLAAVASKALGAVSSVTSGASASIGGVLSGLTSKFASLGGSITSMASSATAALGSFGTAGAIVAGGLAAQGGIHWGIGKLRDRLYEAKVAADQSGNSVKSFFIGVGNSFLKFVDSMTLPGAVKNIVDVGGNIIKGLGNGIVKAGNAVVNGVKKVGGWIVNGFKSFFGIHSPSTLMEDLGIYIPMGLAKGIEDGSSEAVSSINTMGGTIRSAMSSLIEKMNTMTEDEMDLNPTITPVVDMSEVKTAGNNIGDILNKSTSIKDAVSMAAKNALRKGESIIAAQNGGAATNGLSGGAGSFGSQFIFNQYNTSPKSLSAIDIYRQTNNQFAYLKEMVNA